METLFTKVQLAEMVQDRAKWLGTGWFYKIEKELTQKGFMDGFSNSISTICKKYSKTQLVEIIRDLDNVRQQYKLASK